ncbi:MAG: hypothetical protein V4671_28665, partial [Armatimonadota bacterium]
RYRYILPKPTQKRLGHLPQPFLYSSKGIVYLSAIPLPRGRLRRKAGNRHTVRGAGDVVQADLVAERDET